MKQVLKIVSGWLRRRWFLVVGTLLVLAGVFFWWRSREALKVETAVVERQSLTKTLVVSGEIEALEKVDLHFQTVGKMTWLGVKEGDTVKKWQVIATQDQRGVEKSLKQDLIIFEKELREHDQTIENWEKDRRETILDLLKTAQGELDSAVLDVEIRNVALELSRLVTPIGGVVTQLDQAVAGVNITTTDIFQIVNPETTYFVAEVDEVDIGSVTTGQKATIIFDAYSDKEIETEVAQVDYAASTSESGGTVFLIKLKLPETEMLFYRLGMNGEATIVVEEKNDVLAVSLEAVETSDGKKLVTVMRGGQEESVEVKLGIETEEMVEVVEGLIEGDRVVIGTKK
ncbi:hypothetical protein A3A66_00145 [Microgenomates group bacterium RIFCSPLOWO2_01_FULL_46_13]|nr:MAG: hypothetical protein A2783_03425 [Microgenomates group bacterium RIFCSPHIGHO2_01_FULL_45_11]OGV94430.1 MAG: hypothetical protein A3A66_00145 [Microgenomates group bacterium RIFCSPLOWO2_01_FULL_46_13]